MVKWDSELWFPVDFHTVLIAKILLHFGFWSYPGLTVGDWYWPSVIEGDSIFCLCAASHTSCFISPLVDLKPAIFSSLSPSVQIPPSFSYFADIPFLILLHCQHILPDILPSYCPPTKPHQHRLHTESLPMFSLHRSFCTTMAHLQKMSYFVSQCILQLCHLWISRLFWIRVLWLLLTAALPSFLSHEIRGLKKLRLGFQQANVKTAKTLSLDI